VSLYFEPSKIMVSYQTIHKFTSQRERIEIKLVDSLVGYHNFEGFKIK